MIDHQAAIERYISDLRRAFDPGSDFRTGHAVPRKRFLNTYFSRYNTFEHSPYLTPFLRAEWQELLVELTNFHHEHVKRQTGAKSRQRLSATLMRKRKGWFERGLREYANEEAPVGTCPARGDEA